MRGNSFLSLTSYRIKTNILIVHSLDAEKKIVKTSQDDDTSAIEFKFKIGTWMGI